ncbi:unnamed protein product [Parajaminaea phylloscopi]
MTAEPSNPSTSLRSRLVHRRTRSGSAQAAAAAADDEKAMSSQEAHQVEPQSPSRTQTDVSQPLAWSRESKKSLNQDAPAGVLRADAAPEARASVPADHDGPTVAALVATGLAAVLVSQLHWLLGIIAIGIGAHILHRQLRSRTSDTLHILQNLVDRQSLLRRNNFESVEWMNSILASVWPLINSQVFTPFVDLLEDALQMQMPGIVHAVRVEDLDQGVVPLKINSIRILPSDKETFLNVEKPADSRTPANSDKPQDAGGGASTDLDMGEFVNLELSFSYRAPASARRGPTTKSNNAAKDDEGFTEEHSSEAHGTAASTEQAQSVETSAETMHLLLYLAIGLQKIAAVEMPVWVAVTGISGRMRLRIQLVPALPFVKHVAFTLLEQPKLELKAKPLGKRMVIDAMNLPLLSSYVLRSIQTTVQPFVAPTSYTIDVAGILGAGDGPRNSFAVGVIALVIHYANDLPAADANGLADPFVTISYARAGKPLFRTSVLRKNRNPRWNEVAFILVHPDEIRDQDRLRLTVFDADRFSADDPLGKVEICLDRMIHQFMASSLDFDSCSNMLTQEVELEPMRKGWKAQGTLKYSLAFARLVQQEGLDAPMAFMHNVELMQEALHRASKENGSTGQEGENRGPAGYDTQAADDGMTPHAKKQETDEAGRVSSPPLASLEMPFDRLLRKLGLPPDQAVLQARADRRTRVAKLTKLLSGEDSAVAAPPSRDWPSGILTYHIHAINGLEVGKTQRSLSHKSAALFAASTFQQNTNTPTDNDEANTASSDGNSNVLPSSYVQVMVNDEALLSTRVKTLNPRPFINAGAECFVTDFPTSRIDFVVRDRRQREGDPVLGVVGLQLKDVLKDSARWSGWHTLEGGLGVGKMRVTLVWRSVHICIPRPFRGWGIGVLEIQSLRAEMTDDFTGAEAHWVLDGKWGSRKTDSFRPRTSHAEGWVYSTRFGAATNSSEQASSGDGAASGGVMRLPLSGRWPAALFVTLRSTSRSIGKHRKRAMACVRLERCAIDGSLVTVKVPLLRTSDARVVEQVARCAAAESSQHASNANRARTAQGGYMHPAMSDLALAPHFPSDVDGGTDAEGPTTEATSKLPDVDEDDAASLSSLSSHDEAADSTTGPQASRLRSTNAGHTRQRSTSSASSAVRKTKKIALGRTPSSGTVSSEGSLRVVGHLTVTFAFFPGLADEHRSQLSGDHALRYAFEGWTCARDAGLRPRPETVQDLERRRDDGRRRGGAPWDAERGTTDHGAADRSLSSDAVSATRLFATGDRPLKGDAMDARDAESRVGSGEDERCPRSPHTLDDDEEDAGTTVSRRSYWRQLHRQEAGAAQFKAFRTVTWLKQNVDDGWGRVKRHALPALRGGTDQEAERRRLARMEREGVSSF